MLPLLCLLAATRLAGEVVEFRSPAAPVMDVVIFESQPTTRENGEASVLLESDGGVLLLDVKGLVGNNGIPAGAVIESASLRLAAGGAGLQGLVSVESLRSPWRGGSVSWSFFGDNGTTVEGGSLGESPVWQGWVASGEVAEISITAEIQERVNGEARHGWLIRVSEGTALLHLSEQADINLRPVVTVTYRLPDSYYGPRLTDEEVFLALDPEFPGVAAVLDAWQAGDPAAAWAQLEALFGKVAHVADSGNDPARHAVRWIHDHPVPDRVTSIIEDPWSTHFAGIRVGRDWPGVWRNALRNPAFTPESFRAWLKSWIEHGRYLMQSSQRRTNWVGFEASGLVHTGFLLSPMHESADWMDTGFERFENMLAADVYADGLQAELTVGYAYSLLFDVNRVHRLLTDAGLVPPAPMTQAIELLYTGFARIIQPDGRGPGFNDTWPTGLRGSLADATARFPDREDFRYAATRGAFGHMESSDFHHFDQGGILVLRQAMGTGTSSYAEDSEYLAVDFGPHGTAHGHEDKLGMVLMTGSETILGETGRHVYENSKWRSYVLNSWAHSTIRIDGLAQARVTMGRAAMETGPAQKIHLHKEPDFSYASGSFGDYTFEPWGINTQHVEPRARFSHRRHVYHLRPSTYVFLDELRPRDFEEHSYEGFWHLGRSWNSLQRTEQRFQGELPSGKSVRFSFFGSTPVDLDKVIGREIGDTAYPEQLLGWLLEEGARIPIPVLHSQWTARGNNWQALVIDIADEDTQPTPVALDFNRESGVLEVVAQHGTWTLPVYAANEFYGGLREFLQRDATDAFRHPQLGRVHADYYPWIWNARTGWIWVAEGDGPWFAAWDFNHSTWIWIQPDILNWVFDVGLNNWRYLQ